MTLPILTPASIIALADVPSSCYLLSYIQGVLMTMGGPYGSVRDAMSRSDVGRWIPLPDGNWRSEDGRNVIHVYPDAASEAA